MRIPKQFALIVASVLALACGYAAADKKAEDLGTGKEVPAAAGAKDAGGGKQAEDFGTGKKATTGTASKGTAGAGAGTEAADQAPKKRPRSFWQNNTMLLVMLGGVFLLYIFMGRSKRRQAARRKEMLIALKKGAKVTTIGGIMGTVVEVREGEITVKVDETNNARLRVARWAIRGVGEEARTENPDQKR